MTQSQRAGAGSQQLQIMGDYVVQGVTEERAAEIANHQARQVLEEYSREAAPEAFVRIQKLDERVIKVLSDEGTLNALGDPAFQILLQKAQLGAASTEREGDYDLLAQLLSQRATQDTRYVRASVDKAVQVVDAIDESALQGLNMLWMVSAFTPGGTSLEQSVQRLEQLLEPLPHGMLPMGRRWLDHLDIIDLVRVTPSSLSSFKKFAKLYADRLPGLLSVGVEESVATEIAEEAAARTSVVLELVPHEFKEGFFRVPFRDSEQLRDLLTAAGVSEEDAATLAEIMRDKGKVDVLDETLVPILESRIAASRVLSSISVWWDQIPDYAQPTTAGIAIAYANSLRYKKFDDVTGLSSYLESSL